MKALLFSSVLCALVSVSVLFVSSCAKKPVDDGPAIRPVRAQQVFASGGSRTRAFSGAAQAGVESKLSFKVSGTIERKAVKVGQTVQRGQLIAELDPGDYQLRVEDAEAALTRARAEERNADASYERVRGLYENRNASKQDLDAARAGYESAAAAVESGLKQLELAKRQLGYTRLTAPINGSVASVDVELNENVMAGQTIALLTSESDLEVEIAVPGVLIGDVREGDAARVRFDALPGRDIAATVTEVGVAATGMRTTFPVTVTLDEPHEAVRSGMAAEVFLDFASDAAAAQFLVPSVAVGEDAQGRFVFVVEPAGEPGLATVRRRGVTIGSIINEGIEIHHGLEDGEFVVTAGVTKIVDGQTVKFEATE
ncbi:MAG: efflux RND transporter periplasmic adaptor subunit [Candidatus Latescibacterota bacterium]|nr:MAG: efflux RND transporter periplasmic adaptor subunit [Candidatus Latescibacterota bacterium]